MQQNALNKEKEISRMAGNKILKEVIEYDEFGNKKIVQKLVDQDGPKRAPTSNNLKTKLITIIDENGNEVQKTVFIDDQGNIIDENDVDYINETCIDEFGKQYIRQVPKIKEQSLKR